MEIKVLGKTFAGCLLITSSYAQASVPSVPSLSGPSLSTTGNYTVSWSSVAGATRYVLQGESSGTLSNGSSTSISRSKANGTYYYKVKACANQWSTSCGAYSAKLKVVVDIPPPANSSPRAVGDLLSAEENNGERCVNVVSNDWDPDNDTLTISNVWSASNGKTSKSGLYACYTPNLNFSGSDNFNYTISDGKGKTASATVSVSVAANSWPKANSDTAVASYGVETCIDVLSNDTDPDDDSLTISSVWSAPNGSVRKYNGLACYTPDVGFTGGDSFSYTMTDGRGKTDTATITVTVPVPDKPMAPLIEVPEKDEDGIYRISWINRSGNTEYYKLTGETNGVIYQGPLTSVERRNFGGESDSYSYKVQACVAHDICSDYSSTKSIMVGLGKLVVNSYVRPDGTLNNSYGGTVMFDDARSFSAKARTNLGCPGLNSNALCNRADVFKYIDEINDPREIKISFEFEIQDYDWNAISRPWWILFQDHVTLDMSDGSNGNNPISELKIEKRGNELVVLHEQKSCQWKVHEAETLAEKISEEASCDTSSSATFKELVVATKNEDGSTESGQHLMEIVIDEETGMSVSIDGILISTNSSYQVRSKDENLTHKYGFGIYHKYGKSNDQGIGDTLMVDINNIAIIQKNKRTEEIIPL
ncbi:cadherin-like domain-containing protein [Thalassomonas sp. RHCl1]|uniref:cadherin-like domain-containing protein n=1 Tax=Thalassomonas sp. RHCl1 TaxID=2995320 RepID=UPI00248BF3C9|nr:cadherin-like domain-containing protein [Thalassomonas sp. RHCl1]